MYRRSLRFRVAVAFGALGAVLALLFGIASWATVERMEAAFLEATLGLELQSFSAAWLRDPQTPPPTSGEARALVVAIEDIATLPPELRNLEVGRHEVLLDGRDLEVGVAELDEHRLFLLYDEARIEQAESVLLGFLTSTGLLATALSAALGWALGALITAPVRSLARDVRAAQVSGGATLASSYRADDEVGALAESFRDAWERMQGFLDRERAFTADASHQLRTSTMVIASTTELLLADESLPQPVRVRLRRLAQATDHLTSQIEALLYLAREQTSDEEFAPCPVAEIVREVVDRERRLLDRSGPPIRYEVRSNVTVSAPAAALEILVGNLLRNAVVHGRGPIEVSVQDDGVEVRDRGPELDASTLAHAFDRGFRANPEVPGSGLGLAIARRVGQRFGWSVELTHSAGAGTIARVRLRSGPPAEDARKLPP